MSKSVEVVEEGRECRVEERRASLSDYLTNEKKTFGFFTSSSQKIMSIYSVAMVFRTD